MAIDLQENWELTISDAGAAKIIDAILNAMMEEDAEQDGWVVHLLNVLPDADQPVDLLVRWWTGEINRKIEDDIRDQIMVILKRPLVRSRITAEMITAGLASRYWGESEETVELVGDLELVQFVPLIATATQALLAACDPTVAYEVNNLYELSTMKSQPEPLQNVANFLDIVCKNLAFLQQWDTLAVYRQHPIPWVRQIAEERFTQVQPTASA